MAGQVEGLPETIRALDGFTEDVAHMDDALGAIANRGPLLLRPYMPVDTGALRRSVDGDITHAGALITVGDSQVTYAAIVNARTQYIARAEPALAALAEHELQDGIDQTIKKRDLQ